ncbi:MAG TPA: glycosyltransferase family 39 protein [Thermoleophilaceae bacterium]|nr:glycosyltransferase family 39 protein [Thermoleophilaceae bacterium]
MLAASLVASPAAAAAERSSTTAADDQPGLVRQSRLPELAGLVGAASLLLLSLGAGRRAGPVRTRLPSSEPAGSADVAWRLAPWLVVAAFAAAETALVLSLGAGPTIDEGLYIAAGLRTLGGHGISDGYLSWFSGSLLWPAIAGVGYELSGLDGARLMALLSIVVAMVATVKATGNLFGRRARFFAALLLATNGPVLMLAHLAVYDALAVAAVATSLWCITEVARRDHRAWLVAAAMSLSLGVLAKYPTLLFAGPTLTALLVVLRRRQAVTDLTLFGFVFAAVPMILFLSEREQFSMLFTNNLALQTESFGASPRTVAYAQAYFTAVPALLALAGWLALPRRRLLASVLASGVLGPVAYHLMSQNGVSDHKHVVYGLVFAAPLGGVGLAGASRDWLRRVAMVPALAAVALLGVAQMQRLDQGSPDLRPSVDYLRAHIKPGQELLINNSWPFIPYLYEGDLLASPWEVYDVYRVRSGQARGVCDFDWFVDAPGGSSWPARIRRQARRCGTFREVFVQPESMVGLTNDRLDFIEYTGYARIWRNVDRKRSG